MSLIIALGCTGAPLERARPGDPIPGATASELADFEKGRALFHHAFTPEEGLGPAFNQARCSSCHDVPALGGGGVERVRKATRFDGGRCDLLETEGGDLFQQRTTPALAASGVEAEPVSRRANAFAHLAGPPLFGAGAIGAIPDEEILRREDPDDRDGDGISGRAGRTNDGERIGRFGRKASFATLEAFVADAALRELGLTSSLRPLEELPGGQPLPPGVDPRPEPELDDERFRLITHFVRLLALPLPEDPSSGDRESVRQGEQLFADLGCAACHTPVLRTGRSDVSVLDRRAVPLYSDLLLHDLGPELASVCGVHASPSEWRTAPLAGFRFRHELLNQGQTSSLENAIMLHGGEAARSRDRFIVLEPQVKAQLTAFLRSL